MTRTGASPGRKRAYTLVELAVVLVIIGILAPVLYGMFTSYVAQEKIDNAKRTLELAREQMVGYVLANNASLPTPDGDYVPGELGTNTDPWGSRIVYWRAPGLAPGGGGDFSQTNLEVRIYTDVGNGGTFPDSSATLGRTVSNVAYVLVSPGKNLTLDTVIDTSGSVWSVSILRDGGALDDGTGTEFDDIVEFVPARQLQTIWEASGT